MEGDKSRMDAGPCSTVDCQGCTTPPEHLIFGSNRYPQQRPALCKPGGDRLIDTLCEKQKWTFFPLEDIVEMEPDNADAFVDAMLQVLDVNTLLNFRLVNSVWKNRLDNRKAFWAKVQGRRMQEKPVLQHHGLYPNSSFPPGRMYCLPSASIHITPLHLAAFYGNVPLVDKILGALEDGDVNPPEVSTGWTPLHYVAAGAPEQPNCSISHFR